MNMLVWHN